MRLRKLFLKDAKRLQRLFLMEDNLDETGINVVHSQITFDYVCNWIKEYKKMYLVKNPLFFYICNY